MKNIVSCISAKDLITYLFQSRIYCNTDLKIYIISKKFTKIVLQIILLFRRNKCNFIFVDEEKLLKFIGIENFNNLIVNLNIDLLSKDVNYCGCLYLI